LPILLCQILEPFVIVFVASNFLQDVILFRIVVSNGSRSTINPQLNQAGNLKHFALSIACTFELFSSISKWVCLEESFSLTTKLSFLILLNLLLFEKTVSNNRPFLYTFCHNIGIERGKVTNEGWPTLAFTFPRIFDANHTHFMVLGIERGKIQSANWCFLVGNLSLISTYSIIKWENSFNIFFSELRWVLKCKKKYLL